MLVRAVFCRSFSISCASCSQKPAYNWLYQPRSQSQKSRSIEYNGITITEKEVNEELEKIKVGLEGLEKLLFSKENTRNTSKKVQNSSGWKTMNKS